MEQPSEAAVEGVAEIAVPVPLAWDHPVRPAAKAWAGMAFPPSDRPVPRAWERPLVVAPVLATLALIGGQLSSFTAPASYFSFVVGGIMMGVGLAGSPRRPPVPLSARPPARPSARPSARPLDGSPAGPSGRPRGPAAAWWLLPFTWFAAVEAVTFLAGTRRYPTLSRLMDPLLEDELVRSACLLGWLAAFWALVRR